MQKRGTFNFYLLELFYTVNTTHTVAEPAMGPELPRSIPLDRRILGVLILRAIIYS
jgi:hypothetical protein